MKKWKKLLNLKKNYKEIMALALFILVTVNIIVSLNIIRSSFDTSKVFYRTVDDLKLSLDYNVDDEGYCFFSFFITDNVIDFYDNEGRLSFSSLNGGKISPGTRKVVVSWFKEQDVECSSLDLKRIKIGIKY